MKDFYNLLLYIKIMLKRNFIKQHKASFSIILFIIILGIIHNIKPNFIYKKDNTFREFGLGYIKKTVLPMWFIVIVTAILCYLFILYYLEYPRMTY
tara:strand:- start:832 stop:1119 length:288 start_codon:yes stop_codon:yes gene_type:complete